MPNEIPLMLKFEAINRAPFCEPKQVHLSPVSRESYMTGLFTIVLQAVYFMASKGPPLIYTGRSLGIVILTAAQLLIGVIHVLFGFLLFGSETTLKATIAYDVYTIAFGALVLVFTYFIWQGKKIGWVGTIAVSIFVSVADALALLNLPSIPGIPKFAAPTEIIYSVFVVSYLLQTHVRKNI